LRKKDLSLLVLILVVGTVVALINPRFLLVGNLSNTANQVGLFGIISIAEAFVIIIGGIELSVGSVIALLGVLFIDLIVNHDVNWLVAFAIIIAAGLAIGVVHGTLVTRMRIQPFVVTLCGLLIYRGAARYYTEDATAGFGFGASFPTLEWLTAGRTNVLGFPLPHSVVALVLVTAVAWVVLHRSVFGR
jgi:ribose transport system permease protein